MRERLNVKQDEMAELFQMRRGNLGQVECGARDLTSRQTEVLKRLAVDKWGRPGAADKVLKAPDDHTKEELRKYSDGLRISLRHAQEKLQLLQKNFQADTQALVWLQIMKDAVLETDSPDLRIIRWIDEQMSSKNKALISNSVSKQAICAARIAGLEAELRAVRNMLAKKKVTVKRVAVS